MKHILVIAAAFTALNLNASTITALFNGELNSENIQRFIIDDPTNPGWVDTTTGIFTFTRTAGTAPLPTGTFLAFCIEPREFVSGGSTYTYDFSDLEQGTTNIGGMGVTKANLIRELFGRFEPVLGGPVFDPNLNQIRPENALYESAFQIALWEIVRETSGTLNVSDGNITFRNPQDAATLAFAQTMLSSLTGTGPRLNDLYALTNVGAQDVLVQVDFPAPEPFGLVTTGGALIGIAMMLRRRQAKGCASARTPR
jgi:hypothetical protein